jgi:hypothetical protein
MMKRYFSANASIADNVEKFVLTAASTFSASRTA